MVALKEFERRIPWPDDIQCPVVLNFHPDAEALAVALDEENANRPNTQTMYSYGPRVGLQRILHMLRNYKIKASFYCRLSDVSNHETNWGI